MQDGALQTWRNVGLAVAGGAAFAIHVTWWLAQFPRMPSFRDPYHEDWGTFVTMGFFALLCLGGGALAWWARRARARAGQPLPPPWLTLRNMAGFAAIFFLFLALLQWEATGGPWSPSQCNHDGSPESECPDYGYDAQQVRSLWTTAGYALLAIAAGATAGGAHSRLRLASPAEASLVGGPAAGWRALAGTVAAVVLAFILFNAARSSFERAPSAISLAYVGVAVALAAAGTAAVLVVRPRSAILVRWGAVLAEAGALVAFAMNVIAIVFSFW